MQRRTVLAGLAALAGTGALAGCTGGAPGGGGEPSGDGTATTGGDSTEPTDTATPIPTDPPVAQFEVTNRGCGRGHESASVTFGAGEVSIEGTIGGRDTCDTAELDGVSLTDARLDVAVVTISEESDDGTSACGQCLTDIDYTATIDVSTLPDTVVVTHNGETVTESGP